MTYNVFSGTLNPTQSINPERHLILEVQLFLAQLPAQRSYTLQWTASCSHALFYVLDQREKLVRLNHSVRTTTKQQRSRL